MVAAADMERFACCNGTGIVRGTRNLPCATHPTLAAKLAAKAWAAQAAARDAEVW